MFLWVFCNNFNLHSPSLQNFSHCFPKDKYLLLFSCSFLIVYHSYCVIVLDFQGVPLTLATNLFDEAVRVCTEEATRCSISIDDLIQLSNKSDPGFDGRISSCQTLHTSDAKAVHSERKSLRSTSPTGGTVNKNFPSNGFGSGFINNKKTNIARGRALKFTNRYSRHLTETDAAEKQEQNQCILKKKIHIISHCVSRGNRVVKKLLIKLLELIKEAKKHVENLKGLGFTLENVFIEFIDGKSESESDIFEGICVTANSVDVQDKCHSIEHQHIKVCLVDFDKAKHCKATMKNEIDDSVDNCVKKLKHLGIQCVIYNGDNNTFKEIRGSKEIIALKVGSIKHLYSISMATGNPIVSSIHELESEDIKMPIRLSCVGHVHEPVGRGREAHRVRPVISVQFSGSEEKYFTVLICGVTANMSTLLEERLWTSLNRLKNIIDTGKYLTGCGWIEKKCAEKLLSYTGKMFLKFQRDYYETIHFETIPLVPLGKYPLLWSWHLTQ